MDNDGWIRSVSVMDLSPVGLRTRPMLWNKILQQQHQQQQQHPLRSAQIRLLLVGSEEELMRMLLERGCRKGLAYFIILDEKPFRTVEGEGFKYFCYQMQPQFTIPSRRAIARDCFQIYLDEKVRLKALFKSDCNRVAITTDCWTSVQNLNYLTLTAHFIDKDWQYQKRIISFASIPNHRGKTVGKKVEDVLKEWGLKNVSTITVDNAASNDVAVKYLEQKIRNMNGLFLDGFGFHMRYVRSSPHRALKFNECVGYANITCKKLVCLDVSTRWNSTYLMLDAVEKYESAFDKLEDEVEDYRDFFEAFPFLAGIYVELKSLNLDLNGLFASVAKEMLDKFKKYWIDITKMNQLLYLGVIFDPRYKLRFVDWCFTDMYGPLSETKKSLLEEINNNLSKIFMVYKEAYDNVEGRIPAMAATVSNGEAAASVEVPAHVARQNAFQQHLKSMDSVEEVTELQSYLKKMHKV
ncbi:zinc finger BED domain-containing protein RICESLEEPER 2-like [Vicia villosa]|uniref:zinc finger BED domain-containing protein RICESLEEPER 2-like n=1 Tax=Vicia villosa TaxID=3911 RepID=UPI00273B6E61|nr:zinc finger BED domain-containing protein RICESLEEPER 2-like [Vicia villosa]